MIASPRASRRLAPLGLVPALLVLTGCGLFGPASYEPVDRSIEVDAGEEFELELPAGVSRGQSWSLADPRPDRDVVRLVGRGRDGGDSGDNDGGDGSTQHFTFRGVEPGSTKVRLLYCVNGDCGGEGGTPPPSGAPLPTATSTPGSEPAYYVFDITVR
ncbi:protease inhibitor I42 family protein [Streptomyces cavernicola]|uniref:Protease inhibitor I42 family protein n=1 Tax=Streptomyces cavernicola TaxID=3043613 RepID=A0ABT6S707_9ACTN|nr:protease inhibitor I42 family protein [Streptomyces sp. B-S-A6]MDI3403887.1 protease inhibitor I42 family protein [Streptomyces sp. B-S-A6]